MTVVEIRNHLRARPFRPFEIRMADGHHVTVEHPDYLIVPPAGRLVYAYDREDRGLAIIDVLLVTALELLPEDLAS